jgi:hypothetical protein
VAPEHLRAIAAFKTYDMIALYRTFDGDGWRTRRDRRFCRCAKLRQRLMHRGDKGGDVGNAKFIAAEIARDNVRGE